MNQVLTVSEIIAISAITVLFLAYVYHSYLKLAMFHNNKSVTAGKVPIKGWYIFVMLGLVFIFKLIMAAEFEGHVGDINCFKAWGYKMVDKGFSGMYLEGDFTDYPPGYLYVLGFLAKICRLFQIEYGSVLETVIFKIPACLCDMVTGYLIYRIAIRKFREGISVLCSAVYLLNPAIIINSSIWGQVDSVYTMMLVIMCYLIVNKKLPYAYVAFGIGILIKPQMMIFAPILIWAIVEQVFLDGFDKRKFLVNLFSGLGAILLMVLLVLPFGIEKVINQYFNTITSYPYTTVNAYNFWAIIGKNWQDQTGTLFNIQYKHWGTLFIVWIVMAAFYFCFKSKKDDSKYFMVPGFIISAVVMFSVRMHERYMFPALVLILLAFLMKPAKEIFYSFIVLSAVHYMNVSHVLYYYTGMNFSPKAVVPIIIGILSLAAVIYLIFTMVKWYTKNLEEQKKYSMEYMKDWEASVEKKKVMYDGVRPSVPKMKLNKWDFILMAAVVIIYGAVALHDLGDKEAPHTEYLVDEWNTTITLDLGESSDLTQIAYYLGNYEGRKINVESATDLNGSWSTVTNFEMTSVFSWGTQNVTISDRYVRLTCTNNAISLMELALLDSDSNLIEPLNASDYPELFDEQDMYGERTFRNGTYFDEIYHARTAYEYIEGRYCYENTHPPLGKAFIALGMLIFGVNPFGWRVMGVLFGIAMLPVIYLFARKFFEKTWISSIVMILFAFDFMHFSQTRIATIDVFVTFFVILMYYFMYLYTTKSFYDTKLWKTWVPLGLSGISMGLGMASKWTGVYAGLGLAVIFFLTLFRRYKEYMYAKKHIHSTSNGVEHKAIIEMFPKYSIRTIVFCVVFFVIIPFVIYTLSYLPFSDGTDKGLISQMFRNQQTMFNYHSDLESTHPYSSVWYQWPIIYRPIYYYQSTISETVSEAISSFGNPMVWWAGIPAFIYMVYLTFKEKDNKALFLLIAYLSQYMPWMMISRTTYIYHYFTSVPFVVLMVGYSMFKLVEKKPKRKYGAFLYTAAAVGLFVAFYPVLSGQPADKQWVADCLRWFDTWVLIS